MIFPSHVERNPKRSAAKYKKKIHYEGNKGKDEKREKEKGRRLQRKRMGFT